MIRTIHLYGKAAKIAGRRKFLLDVETVTEAVRAIGAQVKGFRQYVEANDWHIVRGGRTKAEGVEIDERMLNLMMGSKTDIHITPVIRGAGGGKGMGIGKIIAGVLLAGFAFFAAPALGVTSLGGISLKTVGMLGVGLAMSGVSQLMSAQQEKEEKTSDLFSGPQMATQGDAVPVIYGKIRFDNPPIISAGISNKEHNLNGADDADGIDNSNSQNENDDPDVDTDPWPSHHS